MTLGFDAHASIRVIYLRRIEITYTHVHADTFDKDRHGDSFGRTEADRFGVVGSAVDEDQQRLLRHRFSQTVFHGNVGGISSEVNIYYYY